MNLIYSLENSRIALALAALIAATVIHYFFFRTPSARDAHSRDVLVGIAPPSDSTIRAYEDLKSALPDMVYCREDDELVEEVRAHWDCFSQAPIPAFLVRPRTANEVATAVKILSGHARKGQVQFAVRSGGHSPMPNFASVNNGIVIDLRQLNDIILSDNKEVVTIQPGARWCEVYRFLEPHGLAVAGGRSPEVGVGGLIVGGGLSFFSPQVGFVCDAVIDFEVVLADGRIVHANDKSHPTLATALKGGGNNFGICTAFTIRTFLQQKLWIGYTFHLSRSAPKLLQALHDFGHATDPRATLISIYTYVAALRVTMAAISTHYTTTTPYPDALRPFTDTPRIWHTIKPRSLADATIALAGPTFCPANKRNVWFTTTIFNDLELLRFAHATHQALTSEAAKKIKSLEAFSLILHPLVPAASRHHAKNAMGLAPGRDSVENAPMVIVQMTAVYNSSSEDFDARRIVKEMMDRIEARAQATGLWHPYKYFNYADNTQDVIASYGEERVRFLRDVSGAYDPHGIWQWAVPGGHKLWKVDGQAEWAAAIR